MKTWNTLPVLYAALNSSYSALHLRSYRLQLKSEKFQILN